MQKEPETDDRIVARANFEKLKSYATLALETQVSNGKWLMASILTVHLAGIFLVATNPELSAARFSSGLAHASGIVLVLLGGFFAWLNCHFVAAAYGDWADAQMLVNPKHVFQKKPFLSFAMTASFHLTTLTIFASGCCIPLSAFFILHKIA